MSIDQVRKAVVAAVGVIALVLLQVFHVTVPDGAAEAVANLVVAALTVYSVFKVRNVPARPPVDPVGDTPGYRLPPGDRL